MSINLQVHPKTIYSDIVSMPDPMLLGVTIHYYNHSDGTLYMKIFGSGTGWSSNSVALGALGTGTNNYYNLDNFLSRAKPAAATTETITLTLKGYSDAGYTTELYSFSRTVTVIFIKSDDGTWTEDFSDNFNDGTVQGWAIVPVAPTASATVAVATDYVLSTVYSLKASIVGNLAGSDAERIISAYTHKTFATPNKTTVYAIINFRYAKGGASVAGKGIYLKNDATILITLGLPWLNSVAADTFPLNKWCRCVVPIPANTSVKIVVLYSFCHYFKAVVTDYSWLDDFKIISK